MRYADRTSVAFAACSLGLAAAAIFWLTRDRGPPSQAAQSNLLKAIGLIQENHVNAAGRVPLSGVTSSARARRSCGFSRIDQAAMAGSPMVGLSLNGATVSSVM